MKKYSFQLDTQNFELDVYLSNDLFEKVKVTIGTELASDKIHHNFVITINNTGDYSYTYNLISKNLSFNANADIILPGDYKSIYLLKSEEIEIIPPQVWITFKTYSPSLECERNDKIFIDSYTSLCTTDHIGYTTSSCVSKEKSVINFFYSASCIGGIGLPEPYETICSKIYNKNR